MASYLDSNTCIDAMRGTRPEVKIRLQAHTPAEVKIASIVEAELLLGAEKSRRRDEAMEIVGEFLSPYEIVAFGDSAAREYARIRAELESKGTPIGPNDLVLAATVLAERGTLITHNTREFQRIPGLRIADWTEERSAR